MKPTLKGVLTEFLGIMDQSPGKTNKESIDNFRICLKCLLHDNESLRREHKALTDMLKQ